LMAPLKLSLRLIHESNRIEPPLKLADKVHPSDRTTCSRIRRPNTPSPYKSLTLQQLMSITNPI
jgi:hypothetical protein